jgi:hypothetical protein
VNKIRDERDHRQSNVTVPRQQGNDAQRDGEQARREIYGDAILELFVRVKQKRERRGE